MRRNQDQIVEELSNKLGGRFSLTTLVIKRMRDYYSGGRTFMPKVKNQSEMFDIVLNEIEEGKIDLLKPGEMTEEAGEQAASESDEQVSPEDVLGEA